MNKRFFYIDNGTISDWTPALNNYKSGSKSMPFVAGQHSLLIGSKLPFNHFYLKLLNSNAHISTISISYWSSNGWTSVVNTVDETNAFANSGFVSFTPNKDVSWLLEDNSSAIPEISSVIVYDHYWLKVEFTHDLNVSTTVEWIGNLFSDDNDLGAEFPDLTRSTVLTSYQAGKTSWQEQHVKAAEIIEQDLINRGIIDGTESILNYEWYKSASVQKVAELIFGAFGDDYVDQRTQTRNEYGLRLVKRLARVDKNNNAIEEVAESKTITGFMSR